MDAARRQIDANSPAAARGAAPGCQGLSRGYAYAAPLGRGLHGSMTGREPRILLMGAVCEGEGDAA